MKKAFAIALLPLGFFLYHGQAQTNAPAASISNRAIKAKIMLPDSDRGYYRGSRFDWSGVVASLEYKGHDFFGVWFPHYDPRLNDAITGPVEEFRSGNTPQGTAIGYDEAKVGGRFLKIGVGVLKKTGDEPYRFGGEYPIVNGGTWVSRPGKDRVEFRQDLKDDSKWGYVYQKTVRLQGDEPELVLEHRLKNTGTETIDTDVYDHDFYVMNGQPTGPDFVVKFPFEVKASGDFHGLAEVRGNQLVYTKELQPRQTATAFLTGFGSSPKDYDIRVENKKLGIGVRQTSDRPISKINFWSIRTTVCPEAYIHLHVLPGKTVKWTIRYHFYTLP